jgi:hypothetical protein
MGFSKIIFIENQTGSGANGLITNRTNPLPALSTISGSTGPGASPAVRIDQTANEALTAVVTGFYFAQTTYNGSPTFVTNQNGIYAATDGDNIFPYRLYYADWGYNTLDYTIEATGQACASGAQVGTVYWSLSTTALTGTSAGTVMPIEVANQQLSFDGGVTTVPFISTVSTVWCINSPFPPTGEQPLSQRFCFDEFARLQQYLG